MCVNCAAAVPQFVVTNGEDRLGEGRHRGGW